MPHINASRLGYIDTLRGVAALCVVWLHAVEILLVYEGPRRTEELLRTIMLHVDAGRVGVVLFFAISGFVVPFSLRGARSAGLRRFAIQRFFRLYPAYWLSMAAGLFFVWYLCDRPFGADMVVYNATMLQRFFGREDILGLYWTLQIELIFYFLCALLFACGWLRSPLVISIAMLLCLSGWQSKAALSLLLGPGLDIGTYARDVCLNLAIMFWGALWRFWLLDRDPRAKWPALLLALVFIVMMPGRVAWGTLTQQPLPEAQARMFMSYAIALGMFVLGAGPIRIEWRFTRWLGEISYSLYLFHPPVLYFLGYVANHLPAVQQWSVVTLVGIVMTGTVVVSAAVFTWVESPAIALGRRLAGSARAAPLPRLAT